MDFRPVIKEKTFIPGFKGNKNQPEGKQIRITIKKFLSATQAKKFRSFKYSLDGLTEISYPHDDEMMRTCVGEITGINMPEDYTPIKNGNDLSKTEYLMFEDLITEIRQYLLDNSEEMTEKES